MVIFFVYLIKLITNMHIYNCGLITICSEKLPKTNILVEKSNMVKNLYLGQNSKTTANDKWVYSSTKQYH